MLAPRTPATRWILSAAIATAIGLAAPPVEAQSFLSRCGGAAGETIAISAERPTGIDCATIALPVEPSEVLAAVPSPRRSVNAPEPETILVTGRSGEGGFSIQEVVISPRSATPPPPYLVPGTDLRAIVAPRLLGPSERAKLDADGEQTLLDCAPGTDQAGFVLGPVRMPPIPGMSVRLVHSAERKFRLTARRAETGEEPRLLATLKSAESATEAQVSLPAELPADTPLDFDILCPAEGGHLALGALVLEAKTAVPPDRAAWARNAALWMKDPATLFARAQHWGITRLYTDVPVGEHGLADPQALAGFIAAAGDRGIAVWALLIDDDDGAKLARAAAALADYNAGMPREAQIKGVLLERAPDRLWIYVQDPGAKAQRLLGHLERLKPLLNMPLATAVPSWFPTDTSIADRMATVLDGLTVISDRTEPALIRRGVARFLAWGARHGRRVDVGLEAMPIPDAERRSYRRDYGGEAWLVPLGDGEVLLLLKGVREGLPGRAFRAGEVAPVPAASRSFASDTAALRAGLDALGRTLGTWPSFGGFALHGLLHDRP